MQNDKVLIEKFAILSMMANDSDYHIVKDWPDYVIVDLPKMDGKHYSIKETYLKEFVKEFLDRLNATPMKEETGAWADGYRQCYLDLLDALRETTRTNEKWKPIEEEIKEAEK